MSRYCTKHLAERSGDELRMKLYELNLKDQSLGLGKAQKTTRDRIKAEIERRQSEKKS